MGRIKEVMQKNNVRFYPEKIRYVSLESLHEIIANHPKPRYQKRFMMREREKLLLRIHHIAKKSSLQWTRFPVELRHCTNKLGRMDWSPAGCGRGQDGTVNVKKAFEDIGRELKRAGFRVRLMFFKSAKPTVESTHICMITVLGIKEEA